MCLQWHLQFVYNDIWNVVFMIVSENLALVSIYYLGHCHGGAALFMILLVIGILKYWYGNSFLPRLTIYRATKWSPGEKQGPAQKSWVITHNHHRFTE